MLVVIIKSSCYSKVKPISNKFMVTSMEQDLALISLPLPETQQSVVLFLCHLNTLMRGAPSVPFGKPILQLLTVNTRPPRIEG